MQASGRVLVCDSIDQAGIDSMKRAGLNVDYKPEIKADELVKTVRDYDVIVVRSRTKVTKDVVDASNAKIIARVGVGLDNVDTKAAEAKKIRVINAPEAASVAVGELAIGLMISLARSIPRADAEAKKGNWIKKELMGSQLSGKYLGIVGVGNIGRNIGRMAKALRMNLIGYDPYPISKEFVSETGMIVTDLDTLLESADFVTCHVPSTPETKHMFNAGRLAKMKSTAFLINTSRGEIIDENALYEALKSGRLAGAALDVFEVEPPTNKQLISLPNVVCTPHIGAQTKEAQELASTVIAEKIIQILRGVI
ncbi:hydroxyacid dehydrogenase [Nitrososphaera sp.]|uniref:hydroxyacid dehydrogenase n=1 Tax=Nitrososphaera sp. TaxID=1971748 RepID=UPI00185BA26B|nr:hydroxyacid dehydrogenase [Nitrososphaera sp.]NWG38220.1 hydroxyacid dehydrogenase [Nitrososphaera sp.]